jgi:hypothetical protein
MVDNLRYDQWKVIEPLFTRFYNKISEDYYFSILPTATQYARNSFFAGLMPSEIEKDFLNIGLTIMKKATRMSMRETFWKTR